MAQKHWKKYLPNLTAALMKKGTFDQETEAGGGDGVGGTRDTW